MKKPKKSKQSEKGGLSKFPSLGPNGKYFIWTGFKQMKMRLELLLKVQHLSASPCSVKCNEHETRDMWKINREFAVRMDKEVERLGQNSRLNFVIFTQHKDHPAQQFLLYGEYEYRDKMALAKASGIIL